MDINIPSQIVVQTAAQWAADIAVYSAKRFLVTSDVFYGTTDQRKFKIADGVQTWSNLDYLPAVEASSVLAILLTGFAAGANSTVLGTDTLAQALAKFQGQINARATTTAVALKLDKASVPCEFIVPCSDLTIALTTGTIKGYFPAPYAFTLTAVRARVLTAATGATLLTVDINEGGVSVLSTKLTFDASEKTTTTAATPAVISDSAIADDAEITIDIDAVGSTIAGAGLVVTLIGTHSV